LSDDDDEATKRKNKRIQAEIAQNRTALQALLKQPLMPTGVSRSYVTRNDLPGILQNTQTNAKQAFKPLQNKHKRTTKR
jgi:hypothetical protein